MAIAAFSGYAFFSGSWDDETQRLAVQQNLRMAVNLLSRELRLAGACLPDAGPSNIHAMAGADSGPVDSLTVRSNIHCAIASLPNDVLAGATSVSVDTTENFVAGMQVYVLHANTTTGEYVTVTNVNQAASRLDLATPVVQSYPSGSSAYGAAFETFAIDASGAVPVLTASSEETAQPAVGGVERLNIRYMLDRNCTPGPCDMVDLPANDSEWALVRTVQVDIGVRSARKVRGGDADGFYRLGQSIEIKPRNASF